MTFANIRNKEIIDFNSLYLDEDITRIETSEEIYQAYIEDKDKVVYKDGEVILNPDWEEEQRQKERQRLDALTLTPADVERALYKAKGMDFEDLKALIAEQIPTVDTKALSIEFRAKDFFRGATYGGMRLFDVVGQLLNITSEQLDKFFETKDYHYLMDEGNDDL